jgi:hypothetical protein
MAADGSDYATLAAGHDPNLLKASVFRGLPMSFYASTGDTVVPRAGNTDALAAKVAGVASESDVIACIGNHGDLSHFQPSDLRAFFDRCIRA